jgi:hypothetical protein
VPFAGCHADRICHGPPGHEGVGPIPRAVRPWQAHRGHPRGIPLSPGFPSQFLQYHCILAKGDHIHSFQLPWHDPSRRADGALPCMRCQSTHRAECNLRKTLLRGGPCGQDLHHALHCVLAVSNHSIVTGTRPIASGRVTNGHQTRIQILCSKCGILHSPDFSKRCTAML